MAKKRIKQKRKKSKQKVQANSANASLCTFTALFHSSKLIRTRD